MTATTASYVSDSRLVRRARRNPWGQRVMLFIVCVLVVNGLVGEGGLADTIRARRELQEVSAALTEIRGENAALRDKARRLENDPAAIEGVARAELGLMRPGEILIIVKKP